jgi:hypothetical protein
MANDTIDERRVTVWFVMIDADILAASAWGA